MEPNAPFPDPQGAPTPVVIAGAGPVGLALALGLARFGVRSVLLEAKSALSEHSKALGIHARTLELLDSWNAVAPLLNEGTFRSRIDVWTPQAAKPLVSIDLESLQSQCAFPGLLLLPQNRTEALLRRELEKTGLCELRFGSALHGFEEHAEGVRVLALSAEGGFDALDARYLVGCDGPHSTVRSQLGWHLEGKTYPVRAMLADIALPDERNELPWPRLAPRAVGALAALKIGERQWRVIASIQASESESEALSSASLEAKVSELFGSGPFETLWASSFQLHCRNSPSFRRGRIVLAGDAAHLNSPAGGQGLNAGLQDAHNLAWKLARALEGGDAEALLASYDSERQEAMRQQVDRVTDALTRLVFSPWRHGRRLALFAVRGLVSRPEVVGRMAPTMAMLTTHYHHSPLLPSPSGWGGKRLPDGPLFGPDGQRHRLQRLSGTQAVLWLIEDGRWPAWQREQVEACVRHVPGLAVYRLLPPGMTPGEGDWLDASGELLGQLRLAGGTALLMRPDGIAGWQAQRPSESELVQGVETALGASRPVPAAVPAAERSGVGP